MAVLLSHRRIKITPSFQTVFVPGRTDVFRLTLTASEAHEMPDAVFAYREIPLPIPQVGVVAQAVDEGELRERRDYWEGERDETLPPPFAFDP